MSQRAQRFSLIAAPWCACTGYNPVPERPYPAVGDSVRECADGAWFLWALWSWTVYPPCAVLTQKPAHPAGRTHASVAPCPPRFDSRRLTPPAHAWSVWVV